MSRGFRCKQFYVAHDRCAMKVSTDSLILGSWVKPAAASRALDIGTGSGLLALMLAQTLPETCQIDGVELDPEAAQQALDNARQSPWHRRVTIHQCAIQHFVPAHQYELVVCNPPYFESAQKATQAYVLQTQARQQARQESVLSVAELFDWVAGHLASKGQFYCLYPYDRLDSVLAEAEKSGLHLQRALHIQSRADKSPHVTAFHFAAHQGAGETAHLCIHQENGEYSQAFRQLGKDFYLKF